MCANRCGVNDGWYDKRNRSSVTRETGRPRERTPERNLDEKDEMEETDKEVAEEVEDIWF